MDKLANRLRHDADEIEAAVSDELDRRIVASLRSITPQAETVSAPESRRPALFWWASGLTGIAAAAAVIVVINSQQPEKVGTPTPTKLMATVPVIDWKAESAMLTGQLQQEMDNLQSDIKKAEQKVKEDIGL
ncbi:MAG: hypothetical protein GY949_14370 [Gammaproteobacteria bacterium]|nr:hypothetical protein [Gammaproteobacteria bacterium]